MKRYSVRIIYEIEDESIITLYDVPVPTMPGEVKSLSIREVYPPITEAPTQHADYSKTWPTGY